MQPTRISRRSVLRNGAIAATTLAVPSGLAHAGEDTESADGLWEREGPVLGPDDIIGNTPIEPQVIVDNDPQILTDESAVWKMWFSDSNWGGPYRISYAESADGLTWTQHPDNPLLVGWHRSGLYQDAESGAYWLFATSRRQWRQHIDLFKSNTGLFTPDDLVARRILHSSQSWERYHLVSPTVWSQDGELHMLYEARTSNPDTGWAVGHARATDAEGTEWVKNKANPVLKQPNGSVGGPHVYRVGDASLCWFHTSTDNTLPTDIGAAMSFDNRHWFENASRQNPTFERSLDFEGPGNNKSQVADADLVIHNGMTYLYYSATSGQGPGQFQIARARCDQLPEAIFAGARPGGE